MFHRSKPTCPALSHAKNVLDIFILVVSRRSFELKKTTKKFEFFFEKSTLPVHALNTSSFANGNNDDHSSGIEYGSYHSGYRGKLFLSSFFRVQNLSKKNGKNNKTLNIKIVLLTGYKRYLRNNKYLNTKIIKFWSTKVFESVF